MSGLLFAPSVVYKKPAPGPVGVACDPPGSVKLSGLVNGQTGTLLNIFEALEEPNVTYNTGMPSSAVSGYLRIRDIKTTTTYGYAKRWIAAVEAVGKALADAQLRKEFKDFRALVKAPTMLATTWYNSMPSE